MSLNLIPTYIHLILYNSIGSKSWLFFSLYFSSVFSIDPMTFFCFFFFWEWYRTRKKNNSKNPTSTTLVIFVLFRQCLSPLKREGKCFFLFCFASNPPTSWLYILTREPANTHNMKYEYERLHVVSRYFRTIIIRRIL